MQEKMIKQHQPEQIIMHRQCFQVTCCSSMGSNLPLVLSQHLREQSSHHLPGILS